jgi:hypothetical protein
MFWLLLRRRRRRQLRRLRLLAWCSRRLPPRRHRNSMAYIYSAFPYKQKSFARPRTSA